MNHRLSERQGRPCGTSFPERPIWITLAGLAVTAVVIVLFMPKYSYWAAAYGHLASYVVMFVLSAVLGAKYYPIPYRWGRLALIVLVMGGCMLCH